ncbi:MAG: hypothetical protein U1F98_05695 [Verrucomicrobiota bacterium]
MKISFKDTLSKVLNAYRPEDQVQVRTVSAPPATQAGSGIDFATTAAIDRAIDSATQESIDADGFEGRFGSPPWRAADNQTAPAISPKFVRQVCKLLNRDLLTSKQAAELAAIKSRLAEIAAERAKCMDDYISSQQRSEMIAAEQKIAAGQEPVRFTDWGEVMRKASAEAAHLDRCSRAIRVRFGKLSMAIVDDLEPEVRRLVEATAAEEIARAEKLEMPLQPSPFIKNLVAFAFAISTERRRIAAHGCSPNEFLFGALNTTK